LLSKGYPGGEEREARTFLPAIAALRQPLPPVVPRARPCCRTFLQTQIEPERSKIGGELGETSGRRSALAHGIRALAHRRDDAGRRRGSAGRRPGAAAFSARPPHLATRAIEPLSFSCRPRRRCRRSYRPAPAAAVLFAEGSSSVRYCESGRRRPIRSAPCWTLKSALTDAEESALSSKRRAHHLSASALVVTDVQAPLRRLPALEGRAMTGGCGSVGNLEALPSLWVLLVAVPVAIWLASRPFPPKRGKRSPKGAGIPRNSPRNAARGAPWARSRARGLSQARSQALRALRAPLVDRSRLAPNQASEFAQTLTQAPQRKS
jgi:hypothetical protein